MGSDPHKTAAAAEDPSQPSIFEARRHMDDDEKAAYLAAMRTVYWLATEEVANRKYPSLLQFQRIIGVKEVINLRRGGNATKESPQVFNELLAAMNEVIVHFTLNVLFLLQNKLRFNPVSYFQLRWQNS